MKNYALSFGVGVLCALLRVRSPAPPLVALAGLLGVVLGEQLLPWVQAHLLPWLRQLR